MFDAFELNTVTKPPFFIISLDTLDQKVPKPNTFKIYLMIYLYFVYVSR